MSESAPIPPDPESERRGHELRDVAIRPILYFLIILFVFGGVFQFVMSRIMDGVIIPEANIPVATYSELDKIREHEAKILDSKFRDVGDSTKTADLQRDTTKDMLEMYKKDEAVLNGYGIDSTGKVHIPIDRAIKKVVEKGLLKSRTGTSKDTIDPDPLPYPAHSEPYKAKY